MTLVLVLVLICHVWSPRRGSTNSWMDVYTPCPVSGVEVCTNNNFFCSALLWRIGHSRWHKFQALGVCDSWASFLSERAHSEIGRYELLGNKIIILPPAAGRLLVGNSIQEMVQGNLSGCCWLILIFSETLCILIHLSEYLLETNLPDWTPDDESCWA